MMDTLSAVLKKKTAFAVLLALAAAGIIVWGGTLSGGFLYDDDTFVVQNENIRTLTPLAKFFSPDVSSNNAQMNRDVWRPLTTFSYAVSYKLHGLNSAGFHAFNVAGHILNAFLFFLTALALLGAGRRGIKTAAFGAALLFLVHPAQSETVAWVSQRSNILFLAFYLGSYLLYIKSFRCPHAVDAQGRMAQCPPARRWYLYGLSAALFALSLLAKEMAASLPAVIFLTAYVFEKRGLKGSLLKALPYAAVALLFVWARAAALGQVAQTGYWAGGFVPQMLTMVKGFAYYLKIAFLPYPLSVEYLFPVKRTLDLEVAACLALLGGVLALAWRLRSGRPLLSLGIFFFFAALLPVANIIPIRTIINERFLYIALAGLGLAAADLLARALEGDFSRLRKIAGLGSLLLLIYSGIAIERAGDWKDHWSFVNANLRTCPQSATLHYGLGRAYAAKGMYAEAAREFELCLKIDPMYAEALADLGRLDEKSGETEASIVRYRQSVQKRVDFFEGLHNLGLAYYRKGDYAAAVKALEKAVQVKSAQGPSSALLEAKTNLAAACAYAGDPARALAVSEEVLRADPSKEKALANLPVFSALLASGSSGALTLLKNVFDVAPVRQALSSGRKGQYVREGAAVRLLNDRYPGRPVFTFAQQLASGYSIKTGKAELAVTHSGAAPGELFVEDGALVYKNAYKDTDVLYLPNPYGVQELILLRSARAPRELLYEYSSEPVLTREGELAVAGLTLSKPVIFDARKRRYAASFVKAGPRKVRIAVPEGLDYPVLVDPAWRPTAGIPIAAARQASALLPNGNVALIGGQTSSYNPVNYVFVYDPELAQTSIATSFSVSREEDYPAVSLKDGRVLSFSATTADIFNPFNSSFYNIGKPHAIPYRVALLKDGTVLLSGTSQLEIFDPYAVTFTTVATLDFTPGAAVVLQNGKVLLPNASSGSNTSYLYDPVTKNVAATGNRTLGRSSYEAVQLNDGRVLLLGGTTGYYGLTAAEIYDPATEAWTTTGSMSTGRSNFYASLLPDGKVVVSGGYYNDELNTAEIYDPAAGTFSAMSTTLSDAIQLHSGALTPNGWVLSAGGLYGGNKTALADLLVPSAGTWAAGTPLSAVRQSHTATMLPNGKVLVAGGSDGAGAAYSTAQLYDPAAGTWSTTNSMLSARFAHSATLLSNGKVLVTGGTADAVNSLSSAELYDYVSGTWASAGAMSAGRYSHSATLLADGRVLAAGGYNTSTTYNSTADIYDPVSGAWSATGPLSSSRAMFPSALLPDGRVLAAGGYNGAALSTAELYDPSAGTWSTTGSMLTARDLHTFSGISNGTVLAAGGYDGASFVSTSEIYDPATGVWASSAPLSGARGRHAALTLPDGRVMLTGGFDGASGLSSVEIYSPRSGWTTSGAMTGARMYHTASLLPNGKILLAGGRNSDTESTTLSSSELASYTEYDYAGALSNGARPEIISIGGSSSFPVKVATGTYVTLSGSRFDGISQGGSNHGKGGNFNSPKAYMKKLGGGNYGSMSADGGIINISNSLYSHDWSSATVKALIPQTLPFGYYYLWTVSNGMPSDFKIVQITTDTFASVPPEVLSVSAVSTGTFRVYFSTHVDETADNPMNFSAAGTVASVSRIESNLSAEARLITGLTNSYNYTATASNIASLYGGAVKSPSSGSFAGVNPPPYFLDDFNRPSGILSSNTPIAGWWTSSSVSAGNSVAISTMAYWGAYGMASSDLSTTGSDAYAIKTLSPAPASLYFRYYVYLPQSFYDAMANSGAQYLSRVLSSANNRAVSAIAYKTAAGVPQLQWEVFNSAGGYPGAYSNVTTDQWHSVEVYAPEIAANTTAYFWLDGKLAASINTTLSDAASWGSVRLGAGWGSSNTPSHTAYFDEARVSTAAYIGQIPLPYVVSASVLDKNNIKVYFSQGVSPEDGRYVSSSYYSDSFLSDYGGTSSDSFRSVIVRTSDQVNNRASTITVTSSLIAVGQASTATYVQTNADLAFIDDFNRPDNSLLSTEKLAGPWDASWLQTGTSLALSTFSFRGAYSLYAVDASATKTDAAVLKNFSTALTKAYARFYVYLSQDFYDAMINGKQNVLAKIQSSANSRYVDIMAYKDASGLAKLTFETYAAGGAYGDVTTGVIATNAWHCIEIYAPPATTGATASLWVDGAQAASSVADFSDAGSWSQLQVGLGWTNYATAAHSAWFDELAVSSVARVGPILPAPAGYLGSVVTTSTLNGYANTAYMGAGGYTLEASSAADFSGAVFSSTTFSDAVYTTYLAVDGLSPNTTYYLRYGALWDGTTVYSAPYFGTRSTLALDPEWAAASESFYSSATVTWTPRPVSPSSAACEGYAVQYGLDPNFVTYSTTSTYINTLSTLTLTGLEPGTTYYFFRVRTLNWAGSAGSGYAASTAATTQLDYWESAWEFPNEGNYAARWGDIDNDGALDLLVSGTNYLRVMRNNRDDTFTTVWSLSSGKEAELCDMDNDGDLDIVTSTPSLYRNDGGMNFTLVWTTTETATTGGVSCGDYNNDGYLDILSDTLGTNGMLYLNRRDSTFVKDSLLPGYNSVASSMFSDLSGDGRQDVFYTAYWMDYYLKNSGAGFQTAWTNSRVSYSQYWKTAAADMNNDGSLDLLYAGDTLPTYVRLQDAPDSFNTLTYIAPLRTIYGTPALADIDNDGLMDAALPFATVYPSVVYKNGGGSFYPVWKTTAPVVAQGQYGMVFGDYNNDGKIDMFVPASYNLSPYPSRLFKGKMPFVNTRPSAPSGLSYSFAYSQSFSTLTFKWDPGNYDAGLSSYSLYYNVAAATAPMTLSSDQLRIVYPSSATGHRFMLSPVYSSPLMGNFIRPPVKVWPGDSQPKHGLFVESAPNDAVMMNTTYYFRVQTIDAGLMPGAWSAEYAVPATPALPPSNVAVYRVGLSSFAFTWDAMPSAPQELSCRGFVLKASTAADFTGTIFSGSSSSPSGNIIWNTGLTPNTTYYARAASYNWNFYESTAPTSALSTLARPVTGAALRSVEISSITVNWLPRPASPPSETAEGYVLEASTAANFTGTLFSSATYSLNVTTISVQNLSAGTTYYLRVGAYNWEYRANYAYAGTTCTVNDTSLPAVITDLTVYATHGATQQLVLNWTAPAKVMIGNPYYDLRYSTWGPIVTEVNFSTAMQLSGEPAPAVSGVPEVMTLSGLVPGVTYYFAIKAVNANGAGPLDTSAPEPNAVPPSFILKQEILGAGLGLSSGRSALGDIDGDGDLDLLAVGRDGANRRFVVYKNDGSGNFSLSQNPYGEAAGYELASVALADVDGDGDLDAVVTGTSDTIYVHLYKNDGSGVFGTPTSIAQLTDGDVSLGDIDNDGDVDLLVNGYFGGTQYLRVYTNSGTGTFTLLQAVASGAFDRTALGDIDGDGDLDLAASGMLYNDAVAYLRIYTNAGGAAPFTLLQEPLAAGGGFNYGDLKFGDIDADGDLDLVAAGKDNTGAQRIVFLANSGGATPFSVSQEFGVGLSSVSLALGDIDNDGDLDLLACGEAASVMACRLYLNSGGAAPFTPAEDILGPAAGFSNGSVVVGDLDGDGDLDAVVNGENSSGGKTLMALDSQWTASRVNYPPGAPTALVGALIDGKLRFKWGNGADNESTDPDDLYYAIRVATNSMAALEGAAQPAKALVPGAYGTPLLGGYLRPRNTANTPPNTAILNTFTMGTSYYWQIKTIDSGLKSSGWSAENVFYTPKFVYPTAKDTTLGDNITESTIGDVQAEDTSGAGPTNAYASDGWYSIIKAKTMYLKDFDTSTIMGLAPFTTCYLKLQYSSDTNYLATNYVQFSTAPPYTNWINIVQTQTGLHNDVTASMDLLPYNIRTSSQVAAIKIKFVNGSSSSGGTNKVLSFDYIFVYAAVIDTTPPSALTTFSGARGVQQGTIDLSWTATGDDGTTGDIVNGGYRIEYSTDPLHIFDNASPQVAISSSIAAGSAQKYQLTGLEHGNTYYMRVFIADEVPNWSDLSNGTTVYLPPPPRDPRVYAVNNTSVTVVYGTVNAPKYILEASTAADFTGTVYSSETYQAALSTLSIPGLYPNTQYYVRAGALWAPTTVYASVDAYPVYTLSNKVQGGQVYSVYPSSVVINWLPLPVTPSSSSCYGYVVQASTAADFSGTLLSSYTYQNQLSTLTVTGLEPCRLYYYRAASLNGDLVPNPEYAGYSDPGSQPPVWISPADNAGYTLNPAFKMWFQVNACTMSDARITISTSSNYEANISTTFRYSQSSEGWAGLPALSGDSVYFTPQSPLTAQDRTFYLKAAAYDGDSWTADSTEIRARVRGDWVWTDPAITPLVTLIRIQHILELRTVVENTRLFRGFSMPSWTDASLQGKISTVRNIHIEDIRSNLYPLLENLGYGYSWTDAPLSRMLPVRGPHISELRSYAAQP